mgnify:CR=1 FL=1|jgi:hypothetical protein
MELNAWLTLLAIVLGPIFAVVISLVIEARRRTRDSKLIILRLLVSTRDMPADSNYSTAINLIPVEFNDDKNVMAQYKSYLKTINTLPDEQNAQRQNLEIVSQQTKLIFAMMQSLGLKIAETDIQLDAYRATGMAKRDSIYIDSLIATKRMADALESMTTGDNNEGPK